MSTLKNYVMKLTICSSGIWLCSGRFCPDLNQVVRRIWFSLPQSRYKYWWIWWLIHTSE
jgi:hypothetical protein